MDIWLLVVSMLVYWMVKFVEDYINIKLTFLGLASLEEIDKTLQFIEKTNNKDIRDSILYNK